MLIKGWVANDVRCECREDLVFLGSELLGWWLLILFLPLNDFFSIKRKLFDSHFRIFTFNLHFHPIVAHYIILALDFIALKFNRVFLTIGLCFPWRRMNFNTSREEACIHRRENNQHKLWKYQLKFEICAGKWERDAQVDPPLQCINMYG